MLFSSLPQANRAKRPVDPIELFEKLPSLPDTPNDLWRGQTEALQEWHLNRNKSDILISLNTGAGKTLVGLLVAQSLVNEGKENVVYLCSTIDLVHQTAKEAGKLGIPCTTRIEGEFDNENFTTGESYCITTYSALYNGLSSIARNHPPQAIIFDDAHVAEKIIRDCYTLTIDAQKEPDLFRDIAALYADCFKQLGREGTLEDNISGITPAVSMVPPNFVYDLSGELQALFRTHNVPQSQRHKYVYENLRDNFKHCCVVFSRGTIEIAPPFLPVAHTSAMRNGVSRV